MMEVKVTLAHMFRKLKVTALEKREDIELCMDLILRPRNGINVRIEPRK